MKERQDMNQADIEKYAFLYFCGKRDRDILMGLKKMTLVDLERFSYLTDLLGLQKYHAQIWNEFFKEFEEKFAALEELYKEDADTAGYGTDSDDLFLEDHSYDMDRQTLWKNDFLKNVTDCQARMYLAELLKSQKAG